MSFALPPPAPRSCSADDSDERAAMKKMRVDFIIVCLIGDKIMSRRHYGCCAARRFKHVVFKYDVF